MGYGAAARAAADQGVGIVAGEYWRVVGATAFVGATWETWLGTKVTAAEEEPNVDGRALIAVKDGNGGSLEVTGDRAIMEDTGRADGGANGSIVRPPL